MPFGIQTKGFIAGIIFMAFVWPYLSMLLGGVTNRAPKGD